MDAKEDVNVLTKVNKLYKQAGFLNIYGVDLIITIVIIICFLIIIIYFSIKNNLGPLRANWDINKCKPSVLPFAGLINKPEDDTAFEFTQKNFISCAETMLRNIVDGVFEPIFSTLNNLNFNFSQLTETVQILFNQITNIQFETTGITDQLYEYVLLLIEPFRDFFTSIKDLFNKIKGIIIVIIYSLYAPLYTLLAAVDMLKNKLIAITAIAAASAIALGITAAIPIFGTWAIPLAVTASTLAASLATISGLLLVVVTKINNAGQACFDPNTNVMLKNGNIVKMKNIELGSILKNGSVVESVMRISNLDNNNIIHKMYKIEHGENNEPIYVTGSHLVYDSIIKNFVKVENYRGVNPALKTEKECPELACLITSDHIIPIGSEIFHDWEDNNGSISKTI